MFFRFIRAFAAACALLLMVSAPASAQVPDPFARELAQALTRVDGVVYPQGFSRAAGPFPGSLSQGQSRRVPLMLRAGQTYSVVGVCDRRCGDFDLRLYDPNGALVTQDVHNDAEPELVVNLRVTGTYQIEALMSRCAVATCFYAFNIYSR